MRSSTPRLAASALPAVLGVLFLFALLAPVRSAEQPADRQQLAAEGAVTYRLYCRNCHGAKGAGDGKLAGMLSEEPSDLTGIALENGGEFPEDEVRAVIDGREEVGAHGTREMPVWGEAFDDADGRTVEQKIDGLVYFVASLQRGDA